MAEVNIGELNTTIRTGEGGATLDADALARIVETVLRAIERRKQSDAVQSRLTRIGDRE